MAAEKGLALVAMLKNLGCPFVEDMDEGFCLSMLLKPAENRYKILHWLLCTIDPSVCDQLEDSILDSGRIDVRCLLKVLSLLGFCHPHDIDLVAGVTGGKQQLAFLEHLLKIVKVCAEGADQSSSLQTECQQETQGFVDELAEMVNINAAFTPKVSLLPPDILQEIEQECSTADGLTNLPKVDRKSMNESLRKLSDEVTRQSTDLHLLLQSNPHASLEYPTNKSEMSHKALRLALTQTSHLLTNFTYTFVNQIQPWCTKTAPALSEMGQTLRHTHTMLTHLQTILDNAKQIASAHDRIKETKTVTEECELLVTTSELSGKLEKLLEDAKDLSMSYNRTNLHTCDTTL